MADITEKTGNGELTTKSDQLVGVDKIEPLIKIFRGQQVMFDRDLATLYGVETKRLNEQVKRNIKRFPEDFMFQLTKDECLRSQIATLNILIYILLKKSSYSSSKIFQMPFLRPPSLTIKCKSESCLRYF